ncbi:acyltransferase family protein [Comamonas sp. CMM01]|uniref:acyltransferase family protein n=1 Tax=Comamonas sp. CMM01 TaxID=2769280 RepID=UPI001CE171CA|nr:acyltransferase family protein [Comamonas sp. CMM01]
MTQADGSQDRLYALDNLRAAMMWLGIVLHVAVIHMAGAQLLPWRDNQTTPAADLLVAFIHAFRMPVFFILAGFFVALLLTQRGAAATVRHRLRRLALPFALFWPPLFAACAVLAMLFMHRMARGTWGLDPGLAPAAEGMAAHTGLNTLHLWFLWLLFWLSVLTPLVQKALQRWAPAVAPALGRWLAAMGCTPWGVAVLTTLLAGIGVQYGAGLVSPGNAFVPPWMEWAHNGLFYVFGLALYAHWQVLLAHYVRRWPWYGVAGLLCFLASGGVLEQVPADARQTLPMGVRWAFSWAYNAAAWCWSFALIGLFTAHLGRHSPAMRYLADSSYWVYLVHMPMTIGFGALLFGLPWPAGVKMLLNIAATRR